MAETAKMAAPDSDMSGNLTRRVVGALADAHGVEPSELDVQLYDYIDMEWIRRLQQHYVENDGADWNIGIPVEGYHVTIFADGTVIVNGGE